MGFMVWVIARLWRGLVTKAQWWCGQTRFWVLALVFVVVVTMVVGGVEERIYGDLSFVWV